MKLVRVGGSDILKSKIEECISSYGWAPEHTYECFRYETGKEQERIFFQSAEGYGLLVYVDNQGHWSLFAEPLAPVTAHAALVFEFVEYCFSFPETRSVELELTQDTRRALLKILSERLHISRSAEVLIWPVLDLSTYDVDLLSASMKSIRNAKNRLIRDRVLSVVESTTISQSDLTAVVEAWRKGRHARDRAYADQYCALIGGHFSGATDSKALIIDGKPEAISAGWPIPNSGGGYYTYLLIHSYAYPGLGEALFSESLRQAKEDGYTFANLGGSGKNLLAFKEKFGTMRTYRTDRFSVRRK